MTRKRFARMYVGSLTALDCEEFTKNYRQWFSIFNPKRRYMDKVTARILMQQRKRVEHLALRGIKPPNEVLKFGEVKYQFTCVKCGDEWETTLGSVIYAKSGCPRCSRKKAARARNKRVTVAGRTFIVQGYEGYAVRYMIDKKGVAPRDIRTRRVPHIRYVFNEEESTHYPDIWVPSQKRLIEVKSTWTLLGKEEYLARLKAKRQAAIRAGYEYSVLVFNMVGERIKLPKGWYLMTRDLLKRYVQEK